MIGGLVVHLGGGQGRLAAALGADPRYVIFGLDPDPANVEQARDDLPAQNLYDAVSVDRLAAERLPPAENLARLVVVDRPVRVAPEERWRAPAPGLLRYGKLVEPSSQPPVTPPGSSTRVRKTD